MSRRAVRLPHKWNPWALLMLIWARSTHIYPLFYSSTKSRLLRVSPIRAPHQLGGVELDKWQESILGWLGAYPFDVGQG